MQYSKGSHDINSRLRYGDQLSCPIRSYEIICLQVGHNPSSLSYTLTSIPSGSSLHPTSSASLRFPPLPSTFTSSLALFALPRHPSLVILTSFLSLLLTRSIVARRRRDTDARARPPPGTSPGTAFLPAPGSPRSAHPLPPPMPPPRPRPGTCPPGSPCP